MTDQPLHSPALRVEGKAILQPLHLSIEALQAFPAFTQTVEFLNDDRTQHFTFTGARLWDVLLSAGVPAGFDERLRMEARAADGFRCLIKPEELHPDAPTFRLILIAYALDELPLPPEHGALRLVVPGDAKGRRYLRDLVSLNVYRTVNRKQVEA